MKRKSPVLILDPRTKLLIILLTGLLIINNVTIYTEIGVVLLLAFLFATNRQPKAGIKLLLFFFFLLAIEHYLPSTMPGASTIVLPLAFMVRRFMMPIVAAKYLMDSTQVGALMSALEKLHLPQSVVIPVAIMMRFFPAMKEDYINIRNSMKMRGIGLGLRSLTQPLLTIEYLLVPMLASASRLGDELAAAAHTKGIENPVEKVRFKSTAFSLPDGLIALAILCVGGWTICLRLNLFA